MTKDQTKTNPEERTRQQMQRHILHQGKQAHFLLYSNQARVKEKGGDRTGFKII